MAHSDPFVEKEAREAGVSAVVSNLKLLLF
jgi:hypothetical protein